jgi:hypothetical protein
MEPIQESSTEHGNVDGASQQLAAVQETKPKAKRTDRTITGKPMASIRIDSTADETDGQVHARVVTSPTTNAAATVLTYHCIRDGADVNAIHAQIEAQAKSVNGGSMNRAEAMLVAQAHTLDVMFNMLAQRAARNMDAGYLEATETYLRLALKAQGQARSTIQTLSDVKNPRTATFIKQANIAEQQQVNNGPAAPTQATRAREKDITPTNEVLTEAPHAALDTGRASEAIGIGPGLETVGAVHRAAH